MRQGVAFGETPEAGDSREFDRATGRALDLAMDPPLDMTFVLDLAGWALGAIGAGVAMLVVLVRRGVVLRRRGERQAELAAWERGAVAGLLGVAARLLPPEHRRRFVEEQCANLAAARNRWEWLVYLGDLLGELPWIAMVQHREGGGQPG
jgi:hypothetical protein